MSGSAHGGACRVALDNDANCAALAEASAGRGPGPVAGRGPVIPLGTGIGGAPLAVEGRLVSGTHRHRRGSSATCRWCPTVARCECGHAGCWEQYSSGNALVRFARKRVGAEPTMLTELCGGRPEQLTGPMVTAAAEDGDLVARQAFARIGEWLGVGLAGLVAAFDPEVVVVGGGVSAAGDRLLEPARSALAGRLVGGRHRAVPPVVAAQLGPAAGARAAAARRWPESRR